MNAIIACPRRRPTSRPASPKLFMGLGAGILPYSAQREEVWIDTMNNVHTSVGGPLKNRVRVGRVLVSGGCDVKAWWAQNDGRRVNLRGATMHNTSTNATVSARAEHGEVIGAVIFDAGGADRLAALVFMGRHSE